VPSSLPDGELAPTDGSLPEAALGEMLDRPFGVYVHVPFCLTRCGYCDFNTYTAAELGPGASRTSYAGTVRHEVRLARRVLADSGGRVPPAQTVFRSVMSAASAGASTTSAAVRESMSHLRSAAKRTASPCRHRGARPGPREAPSPSSANAKGRLRR